MSGFPTQVHPAASRVEWRAVARVSGDPSAEPAPAVGLPDQRLSRRPPGRPGTILGPSGGRWRFLPAEALVDLSPAFAAARGTIT